METSSSFSPSSLSPVTLSPLTSTSAADDSDSDAFSSTVPSVDLSPSFSRFFAVGPFSSCDFVAPKQLHTLPQTGGHEELINPYTEGSEWDESFLGCYIQHCQEYFERRSDKAVQRATRAQQQWKKASSKWKHGEESVGEHHQTKMQEIERELIASTTSLKQLYEGAWSLVHFTLAQHENSDEESEEADGTKEGRPPLWSVPLPGPTRACTLIRITIPALEKHMHRNDSSIALDLERITMEENVRRNRETEREEKKWAVSLRKSRLSFCFCLIQGKNTKKRCGPHPRHTTQRHH